MDNLNLQVSASQISLHGHIFFKCCATWDICKCHTGKLTNHDKRYRKLDGITVKTSLMYNKYQEYQDFKRKYPGISFGDFVAGKHF